jgi:hypothetical protein
MQDRIRIRKNHSGSTALVARYLYVTVVMDQDPGDILYRMVPDQNMTFRIGNTKKNDASAGWSKGTEK